MPKVLWKAALAAAEELLVAASGGAVAKGAGGSNAAARFAKIDPALYASHGTFMPASLSNRQVAAVVQLGGAPVAVRDAKAKKQGAGLTKAQKDAIRAELRSQQDALHGKLAQAGAKIVGQMQDAYNGIHIVVARKNIAQLATLPNVVGIHAVPTFKPTNVNGVPFVGAPQAWGNFGYTGAGVKVAILDTGIDYTHADFGGPGTEAAFNAAFASSTAPADPSIFGPAAPKVKGGFDFVGDDYDADDSSSVPQPDPNPLDCNGHGTHTAGTAAGFGVLDTGATYGGPYNATAVSSHSWRVGPGVAPQANLYAYRVFGCGGSSNIVDLAINQAVADGVDVISMSLGSPLGGTDDPTTVAAQNAVNAGISVVASAGNSGGNGYMVGSPSTANGVLSVAAMDATTPTFPGGHFALSTGETLDALNANAATFSNGLNLPIVVVRDSSGEVSLGCSVEAFEAANVTGKLAVVQRGTCARVAKAVYGRDAGAAAVAMINNTSGYPPFEGEITVNQETGENVPEVTIPFFGISDTVSDTDGTHLIAADGGSVVLTNVTLDNPGYATTTEFSSGGPRNPDSAPKPDVIAPGLSVSSAAVGSGSGSAVISGTSMACPMTAGVAALVKQAHPSWNGLQIKAAIMNTADASLNAGYDVRRAGAGVVQAQKAVNSSVEATTSDQLDSIAFGYVPGSGAYSATKAFTLTNYGSSTVTYNLDVSPQSSQGAVVTVSPAAVTLAAGASMTVDVELSMSAAAFAALPTVDTFAVGPGVVNTVRGAITATPAGSPPSTAQALRVPYLTVPRGLSNVVAGTPGAWTKPKHASPDTFTSWLPLLNDGIHDGTADLYAWGISDPNESGGSSDVRDAGLEVFPGADFGVSDSDRGLVFLINTHGRSANQSINEYDVLIDTNHDGEPDYAVVGIDLGLVFGGEFDGQFGSFTIDASTGEIVDAFYADAPMNGSVVELPAIASEIGLYDKGVKRPKGVRPAQQFAYAVNAFGLFDGSVDTTGVAAFNPFNPAVSSGDFAVLDADGGTASLSLTVSKSQLPKQGPLGWLVASVDDANGASQADEVSAPKKKSLH